MGDGELKEVWRANKMTNKEIRQYEKDGWKLLTSVRDAYGYVYTFEKKKV